MTPREPLWRRYLRFLRDDVAADVDDELRFHTERLTEELVARGLAPAEARRYARERMGDLGRARRETLRISGRRHRRAARTSRVAALAQDVRYAARSLLRTPLFAVVAGATLALGVGANVAVFSVLDGVVLRPLPYRDPGRLVMLWEHNLPRARTRNVVNPENAVDWRSRNRTLASLAIYSWSTIVFTGGDVAERVPGRTVTPNFFNVLGVHAALGRTFVPADSARDAPHTIVLSQGLWQRRFGADSGIIGRAIPVAGGTAVVVGVMPAGFRPMGSEQYWEPGSFGAANRERSGRWVMVIARLADGVTVSQAQTDLSGIARQLAGEFPDFDTGWTVDVVPLREDVVGGVRQQLFLALGAVVLVLLIAVANVGNLILVRAAARRQEMSVRAALGAGRSRLARLWLIECGVLALLGVGAGLLVAWAGVRGLVALAPPDIPRLSEVRLDTAAFLLAAGLALVVTMLLAVAAAVGSTAEGAGALHDLASRHTTGVRARRFRHALVVAQVSLALVLLHGAGLLLGTLRRLQQVDPGFESAQVLAAQVMLPTGLYGERQQWGVPFFSALVDSLRGQPGVASAGIVSAIPLTGLAAATSFRAADRAEPPPGQKPVADIRVADQGYFRVLRIPLLRGRLITPRDDSQPVIVVNEALAREFWPDGDPLGKQLFVNWRDPSQRWTIVGVVGDTRTYSLDEPSRGMIYFSPLASPQGAFGVVIRGHLPAATLSRELRSAVRRLDPAVPVDGVETLGQTVDKSLAGRRSPAFLLALLSGLALLLAGIGLYGVLAYAVGLRSRELGVRVALGARPTSVVWIVVRSALALCALGIVLGVAGSVATTRALRGMLYDVRAGNPVTFAAVAAAILVTAALASWIPARRASRLDPTVVMRAE